MKSLAFTRKELEDGSYYGCPCSPCGDNKDWEKEIVHPKVQFTGKQAEVMGIDGFKLGDVVDVTLRLRVCELRSNLRKDGDKELKDRALGFEALEASDYTDVEDSGASGGESGSPILSMLKANA